MNFSGLNSTAAYQLAREQGLGIPATQPAMLPASATQPDSAPAGSFQNILQQTQTIPPAIRKTAGDLVAHALILPILKQIRRSSQSQKTIFSGGIGENTFGPEFDMQIADRIAHSHSMTVTDAVARRLANRSAAASPVNPEPAKNQVGVDVHG